MRKKIINILCHTLNNDSHLNHYVFGNWSSRQANTIIKYSHQYDTEVWYAVRNLPKKRIFKKKGITYRLFPAKTLSVLLESYFGIIFCSELFSDLGKENSKKTLIHFQGERGTLLHWLLFRFRQFKVILQYHGYGQPPSLDWVERISITPLEKINFQKIVHFFVPIEPRISYLIKTLNIPTDKISIENNGVDFNLFKPLDKKLCREKLNIPQNAFGILYIGTFSKNKGVDKIIYAYRLLKKKYPQLFLLMVGGNRHDFLYNEVKQTADYTAELVDQAKLPLIYNAANAYCFYGNSKTIKYAGPGVATTEALACNLNVISTNLFHFPDIIVDRIGLIPKNFNNFLSHLESLIQNPKKHFHPRQLIEKYTSYKYTTQKMLEIYDQVFNET